MRYYRTAACKTCAERPRCTENKRGRIIKRLVDEAVLDRVADRLRGSPEKMRLRGRLVEHPFGTMKRGMNMMRKGQVKRLSGDDARGQATFVASLFGIAA